MILEKKEEKIKIFKPWMGNDEINLIKSYLKSNFVMLEWGGGGSTIELSKYVKEYYCVEHDMRWYNKILSRAGKNVKLFHIPPNTPDLNWFPVFKEGGYEDFKDYIKIVNIICTPDMKLDDVLIDGRARVECAIEVLPYLSKSAAVFIHDFERVYYWKVLEHYSIEKIMGKLAVLRKKKAKNFESSCRDRLFLIKKYLL